MEKNFFKIHVGSLARSGSTYLRYLIENQYDSPLKTQKSHNPKEHEARADRDFSCDEFVFAVRAPIDTLKSQLVWRLVDKPLDRDLVRSVLNEASHLWEVVLSAPEEFFIVDFEAITSKESEIMAALEAKHPSLLDLKSKTSLTTDNVKSKLEYSSKDGLGPIEYIERGHLPRQASNNSDLVESELASKFYTHRINYLESLYQELISRKEA